ncbi:DUF695 domain-containing protein [Chitinophaga sancti]|uniref:DUF695 domain-containing protein n=1 Tax=Chitinophaga sancti TaxID=1004 RepID=A0A1K1SJA8_9BACT|nr:DUF695 domain-containing protein [Chitinophaga sancti]WQD64480.1 DUF695 domain-containing protein [Chitinophaga sancti]WQG89896.1 DUF695 domain-containing protein [Chitinophaga sancti]SFW84443.1 Family of unknown function [Chitinophaga sancti]
MGLFDFLKQPNPNAEFWNWFKKHEKDFFKVLQDKGDIQGELFNPLAERLSKIREGYFFLAGIHKGTAELILTADGKIKNIPFIEELVAAAPTIPGWTFMAAKPATLTASQSIGLGDYRFDYQTLFFFANEDPQYPDKISITVVHDQYTAENREQMVMGVYIFLDNYLGEIKSATVIDAVDIAGPENAGRELIPIHKLKAYIDWREKEFVEKYDGLGFDKERDSYTALQAEDPNGIPMLMVVNAGAMQWEYPASYPWILEYIIKYPDDDNAGLPGEKTMELMETIEEELRVLLAGDDFMDIGRVTSENRRSIYFTCREFRAPVKAADTIHRKYEPQIEIEWDVYKDKYWQSLDIFRLENWNVE